MISLRSGKELPPELMIRVLSELDLKSLIACKRVCRSIHDLIAGTAELQYKKELIVAGMDDGPSKTLSIASRLEKLRAHQKAWSELKWTEETWVSVVLSRHWELYAGVWSAGRANHRGMGFMQLPSRLRDIPMRQWDITDIGFLIRDFTLDPSQNLLVLIEMPTPDPHGDFPPCRIHLRTMDTGLPHPLAHSPLLLHKPYLFDSAWRYIIQVTDVHLGVMFRCPEGEEGTEHELVVWNWRSGEIKMTRPGIEMESFAFLTDKLIMISMLTFRQDLPTIVCLKPVLCITDFTRYSSSYRGDAGRHSCELGLPELIPGVFPSNMLIRADPGPSYSPDEACEVPFHVGSQNRIFVVTFTASSRRVHAPVTLFIPLQTLLDKYEAGGTEIEWEQWGPAGTRILGSLRTSPNWVCYVYGSKFVHRSVPEEVEVYDFNPWLPRLLQVGASENLKVMTEPSTFEHSAVFKTPITTAAPYIVTTVRLPDRLAEDPFAYAMLSEDNLFFISQRVNNTRVCCLLTF